MAAQASAAANGIQVFAGQRDDGFYVNLGVFDLLRVPPVEFNTPDSRPDSTCTRLRSRFHRVDANRAVRDATEPDAVIGVWSTAVRPPSPRATAGEETHNSHIVRSRLECRSSTSGHPESLKDGWNAIPRRTPPYSGSSPTPGPKLLLAVFGVTSPCAPPTIW